MYFSSKCKGLNFIYNIGIHLVNFVLPIVALFNTKIRKGVRGRSHTFNVLKKAIHKTDKTLWFHCASLGEYEQGLPLFNVLRMHYADHNIVLTFFSPSGYEIRKNSPIANVVAYLPIDTKRHAKKFLDLVNPELTVFVKYDIWPNFLNELKSRAGRAILISASFRKNQSYFKFYGKPLRQALWAFEHIFTQNTETEKLLQTINYYTTTVAGDTRFDRVYSQLKLDNTLDFIADFKDEMLCVVAGSTWPEGEDLLVNYINNSTKKDIKFIIAPHSIKTNRLLDLKKRLQTTSILFSEKAHASLKQYQVFIIDAIGILTKIYSYADIAYVGGAMGNTGLHNTLEPAVFGIPIIIGNHYSKFPEAKAFIEHGGMFSVSNQFEFDRILKTLIENEQLRVSAGKKNAIYIKNNQGVVNKISEYLQL